MMNSHLLHDQARKGYGPIPGVMSQTSLHACLQRLATMQTSLCPGGGGVLDPCLGIGLPARV